jgi:hypothetical protein
MLLGSNESSTSEASRNLAAFENVRRCPAILTAGAKAVRGRADLLPHLSAFAAAEALRSLFCGEESACRLKTDDTGRRAAITKQLTPEEMLLTKKKTSGGGLQKSRLETLHIVRAEMLRLKNPHSPIGIAGESLLLVTSSAACQPHACQAFRQSSAAVP